ncbi:hypothetical protein PanWU01x14_259340, partial [Parasponia andersonii]
MEEITSVRKLQPAAEEVGDHSVDGISTGKSTNLKILFILLESRDTASLLLCSNLLIL